jgi:hypothetical protein
MNIRFDEDGYCLSDIARVFSLSPRPRPGLWLKSQAGKKALALARDGRVTHKNNATYVGDLEVVFAFVAAVAPEHSAAIRSLLATKEVASVPVAGTVTEKEDEEKEDEEKEDEEKEDEASSFEHLEALSAQALVFLNAFEVLLMTTPGQPPVSRQSVIEVSEDVDRWLPLLAPHLHGDARAHPLRPWSLVPPSGPVPAEFLGTLQGLVDVLNTWARQLHGGPESPHDQARWCRLQYAPVASFLSTVAAQVDKGVTFDPPVWAVAQKLRRWPREAGAALEATPWSPLPCLPVDVDKAAGLLKKAAQLILENALITKAQEGGLGANLDDTVVLSGDVTPTITPETPPEDTVILGPFPEESTSLETARAPDVRPDAVPTDPAAPVRARKTKAPLSRTRKPKAPRVRPVLKEGSDTDVSPEVTPAASDTPVSKGEPSTDVRLETTPVVLDTPVSKEDFGTEASLEVTPAVLDALVSKGESNTDVRLEATSAALDTPVLKGEPDTNVGLGVTSEEGAPVRAHEETPSRNRRATMAFLRAYALACAFLEDGAVRPMTSIERREKTCAFLKAHGFTVPDVE